VALASLRTSALHILTSRGGVGVESMFAAQLGRRTC
jgi:hypothetical protein